MSSDVAISVRDLNKIYGVGSKNEKVALNNISLQVKKGSIFGLLGPNGAGKSTFINILADLVRKTSGHIDIFGMSHDEKLKDVKKLMGIVPQELNIDPFFTPYELLEIQAGLFGVPKNNRRTNEILKLLALEDKSHAYARTLSGGMRRRLLIAKAMVHNPEILILDEPTAGVDVELRANLWANINKLNNEGKTIIITTHYLHEAEELCNEIAIIDNGNLITKDTTSNIKSLIDRKQIIISLDSKNFNLDPIMGLDVECEINSDNLIINYKPSEIRFNKILDALRLSNIQIKDLTINETKLEDVFLKLTKN
ncbi:MAG: multidrug ABC transporter ATP-binding protein [Candidatus Pelagibacterales bacterium]|nr:MAG: multidrug ABC transporter ATP-binding protein [Pelagibacterales bacterium]